MKKFVEFLATGEVTWANRSGDNEKRQHVRKGSHLIANKVQKHITGGFEIWQGGWSIVMPAHNIKISDVPKSLLAKIS